MFKREEIAQELLLREHVRKAISVVSRRRGHKLLAEQRQETQLRNFVRELLKEGNAVATSAKHSNTGINVLEDLLKNSNILSVLEQGYKSLTTNPEQRRSYRNHIEVFIKRALAPEEERKIAGRLEEDINIDIDDPKNDPDFIDVEEDTRSDDEVELDSSTLPGADLTGRNKAYRDFKNIEKVILQAYDDLDDPEDSGLFEEYLVKNVALYFEKYESELEANVEEPDAALDAEVDAEVSTDIAMDAGDETDAAPIELQEIIKFLNVDDIIENLL